MIIPSFYTLKCLDLIFLSKHQIYILLKMNFVEVDVFREEAKKQ